MKTQLVDNFLPVIGMNMEKLINMLHVFCLQEETILISGPTGAGKTRLARWCHHQSRRSDKNWCTIDLNSIPETMQLAELFGWKKGAFTSAEQTKTGIVEHAEGGTLFIDEIDKLSLKSQAGLLDFLETKSFRPLGESGVPRYVDVRIIVGTNVDLKEQVRQGSFREDLYYRINVLPAKLPALSDREDEIIPWAKFMVNKMCKENGHAQKLEFEPLFLKKLTLYHWPGNLRQLDNVLRRAYVIAASESIGNVIELKEEHIDQSLEFEDDFIEPTQELLSEHLFKAADLWLERAERHGALQDDVNSKLLSGFRGMVYMRGLEKYGSVKDTFKAFGKDKSIDNRNHLKEYKRELDKVEALLKSVGEETGARSDKIS